MLLGEQGLEPGIVGRRGAIGKGIVEGLAEQSIELRGAGEGRRARGGKSRSRVAYWARVSPPADGTPPGRPGGQGYRTCSLFPGRSG